MSLVSVPVGAALWMISNRDAHVYTRYRCARNCLLSGSERGVMRDHVLGKLTTKTALRCGANLPEGR